METASKRRCSICFRHEIFKPETSSLHSRPRRVKLASASAPFGDEMTSTLKALAAAVSSGSIRAVDLTQTLSLRDADAGPAAAFRPVRAVQDGRDLALRRARRRLVLEQFHVGEHTGTHFDAPVHWVTGKDLKNNTLDMIVPEGLHRAGGGDRLLEAERRRTPTSCSPTWTSTIGRRSTAASRRARGC